jgi:hypothetical protein
VPGVDQILLTLPFSPGPNPNGLLANIYFLCISAEMGFLISSLEYFIGFMGERINWCQLSTWLDLKIGLP